MGEFSSGELRKSNSKRQDEEEYQDAAELELQPLFQHQQHSSSAGLHLSVVLLVHHSHAAFITRQLCCDRIIHFNAATQKLVGRKPDKQALRHLMSAFAVQYLTVLQACQTARNPFQGVVRPIMLLISKTHLQGATAKTVRQAWSPALGRSEVRDFETFLAALTAPLSAIAAIDNHSTTLAVCIVLSMA